MATIRPIKFTDPELEETFEGQMVTASHGTVICAMCDLPTRDYVTGPDVYGPGQPEHFCLRDFFGSDFTNIEISDEISR